MPLRSRTHSSNDETITKSDFQTSRFWVKISCFYDRFWYIFHLNLKEDVSNLILKGETRGPCSPNAEGGAQAGDRLVTACGAASASRVQVSHRQPDFHDHNCDEPVAKKDHLPSTPRATVCAHGYYQRRRRVIDQWRFGPSSSLGLLS